MKSKWISKRIWISARIAIIIFSGLFLSVSDLTGQEYSDGVKNGTIMVKFRDGAIPGERGLDISYKKGVAKTSMENLDRLNSTYRVLEMKRVFPYSVKHEAKHRKHGLHLWYEISFDTTAQQAVAHGKKGATKLALEAYLDLEEIDFTEAVLEKELIKPFTVRALAVNTAKAVSAEELMFNDPLLPKQWHYDNTGQSDGTPGEDIRLFDAWEINSGSRDIIVSIHDEGVDVDHQDLAENIWINELELNGEPNFDDDGNGYKDDIYGFNFADNSGSIPAETHGTHVAGTIGAVNNNGIGVSGIAGGSGNGDGIRLMSCRILGGRGSANTPASYIYAADNGAHISQNSWGYLTPDSYEQVVLDAIDYFIAEAGNYPGSPMRGGVVICASGNVNSEGKHYPAAYEPCIAVTGLDANSHKAPYSNFGEWTDIAAPGGDVSGDGSVGDSTNYLRGVLSTITNNAYGYLDGTSMACPHVSGVAALVASQYGGAGFTNDMLLSHLLTGVREEIYEFAPNIPYLGKLGVGATHAEFALARDEGLAPESISDLELGTIAQDEAMLSWTVPADPDDEIPYEFEIFYSESEISDKNLDLALSSIMRNRQAAGEAASYELEGLKATTNYYFAVRGIDRWGNMADLSNVIQGMTTEGPEAELDPERDSISIMIDVNESDLENDTITLYNRGEGVLRWEALTRHASAEAMSSSEISELEYPIVNHGIYQKQASLLVVPLNQMSPLSNIQEENDEEMSYLDPGSMSYWALGETDTAYTNSTATRFLVSQKEGFNLTHIDAKLYHERNTGPVIVEVYAGEDISTASLLLAQELEHTDDDWDRVELKTHLYFEPGTYFWTVFHVPAGNLYPLGAGLEASQEYSQNCYISLNMGRSWTMLEDAYFDNQLVWAVYAMSRYQHIGEYITLLPGEGELASMDSAKIVVGVDGSEMINGIYSGEIVIHTNETDRSLINVPVDISISGHLPELSSEVRPDFGGVMLGRDRTIEIPLQNNGFGRFTYASIDISDPQFEYVTGKVNKFEAKTEQTLVFRFTPDRAASSFANVTLRDAEGYTYQFQITGVGFNPPVASLIPESDTFNVSTGHWLTIGDTISGDFVLANTGTFPLDYYMPAYSEGTNMEDVSGEIHKFGYISRVDTMGLNPEYKWEDISGSGEEVSTFLTGTFNENAFHEVELGFEFPFFGKKESSAYITRYGLISFDADAPIWARIPLSYKNQYNPDRHISAWGLVSDFAAAGFGKVYYKRFMDRFIVQYDSIPSEDGWYEGTYATFQIVLHDNGNINFYYKDIHLPPWVYPWGGTNDILARFTYIGMEDKTLDDGLVIHDYEHQNFPYRNGSAIEFINPGLGLAYNVTNTYGTVDPGDSVTINYSLKTDSLYVQEYNEVLPVVTNDPENNPLLFLVNFEISAGGASEVVVSTDSLGLGPVFQYDSVSQDIIFENVGKATDSILSATFDHGFFRIHGRIPEILKPKRSLFYPVSIVSETMGSFADTLRILFKSGQQFNVALSGEIIGGPEISVNPESITATTGSGKSHSEIVTVSNSGDYKLTLSPIMNDWIEVNPVIPEVYDTLKVDYFWESSLEEGGPSYKWIEIADTGTKVTGLDAWAGKNFTEGIPMPFSFNFYGVDYDTLYIGYAGLITFTGGQGGDYRFGGPNIPHPMEPDNFIAPLWVGGGTEYDVVYPLTGQYYYMDEEKVIVEYRDYINGFSMGLPISFQVILYKNNKMKFQYLTYEPLDLNFTPEYSVIGIENHDASRGVEISHYTGLVSQDMAISVYPVYEYIVPQGESKEFEVTLDASELYAGTYETGLELSNDDPLNKDLAVPVSLTVTGKEAFAGPDSIFFGDLFVIEKEEYPFYESYRQEFTIENPGTDILSINKFTQDYAAEVFVEAYVYRMNGLGFYSWDWHPVIQQNPWDTKITPIEVAPSSSLALRATIMPDTAAELDHNLIIATSLGTRFIPVMANANMPPRVVFDQDSIIVFTETKNHTESRSLEISNLLGGYPLTYELVLEFDRRQEESVADRQEAADAMGTSSYGKYFLSRLPVTSYSGSNVSEESDSDYLRRLSHDQDTVPATLVGYGGGMNFHTATRFIAPEDGFNLGSVQTWYVPEGLLESEVKVKVYGGSPDIYQAELLHEESFIYTVAAEDNVGSLVTFMLSESILFFPNEPFFIEFGYDAALAYPQGIVSGLHIEGNRFMYGAGDLWYDLIKTEEPFNLSGWMVRAIEDEYASSAWITLDSPNTGMIDPGSSVSIDMTFDARPANSGKNYASLRILSNDPSGTGPEATLLLWINAGPVIEVEKTDYRLLETETLVIEASAYDMEGDNFSMSVPDPNSFTEWEFRDGILFVTLNPDYGDQGFHDIEIQAIDEQDNSSSEILRIEVINVNRPPVPVEIGDIELQVSDSYYLLSESEMFLDPDGDEIVISAVSENRAITQVYESGTDLLLQGISQGSVGIQLIARDIYEASAENEFLTHVSGATDVENQDRIEFSAYPNPVSDYCMVQVEGISGAVRTDVLDATGRNVKTVKTVLHGEKAFRLDLSGLLPGSYTLLIQQGENTYSGAITKL